MRVIQIHENDGGGGGGIVAYNIMKGLSKEGIESELYVGCVKLSNRQHVKYLTRRAELIDKISQLIPLSKRGQFAIRFLLTNITSPKALASLITGKEYKNVYGSAKAIRDILDLKPDIVHCHNLHSNYFDLSSLILLSQKVPTVITLHDAWLLTGQCCHFFECMKWKTGCGGCPHLSSYLPIHMDATAHNWIKRRDIFKQCKLYVTAPSAWILNNARQSIMIPGIVNSAVIPNGINLDIFHPADKTIARSQLSLPLDKFIIIFSANRLKHSSFKDYKTFHQALECLAEHSTDVLCLALGDSGNSEFIRDCVEIRFIPFITDQRIVAQYYQAADVYVHPAKADTFPTSVIEAEACGLPVVASAVCGIPEQIIEGKTGYLILSGDAQKMAERIAELKENVILRKEMGKNAATLAKERYDEKIMIKKYIDLYKQIV